MITCACMCACVRACVCVCVQVVQRSAPVVSSLLARFGFFLFASTLRSFIHQEVFLGVSESQTPSSVQTDSDHWWWSSALWAETLKTCCTNVFRCFLSLKARVCCLLTLHLRIKSLLSRVHLKKKSPQTNAVFHGSRFLSLHFRKLIPWFWVQCLLKVPFLVGLCICLTSSLFLLLLYIYIYNTRKTFMYLFVMFKNVSWACYLWTWCGYICIFLYFGKFSNDGRSIQIL